MDYMKPITIPSRTLRKLDVQPEDDGERRPTTPHTSYSQLSMYIRCSMQYYFRYVAGLKEKPKVSLSIGKGGHAALEWNTKSKLKTGIDRPEDDIIDMASDMMDVYMSEMPFEEYEKDVEPGALKDKQLAATRIYRRRDAPDIIPIGAEVEYNLDLTKYLPAPYLDTLAAPLRPVNMKIDVLYQDTETVVLTHNEGVAVGIEDYKYVSRKMTQATVNMSPQLTTYAVALRDITKRWPTKLGIRMMHPGSMAKRPDPDNLPNSIPLLREPDQMSPEALETRMRRVAYQFAKAEEGIRAEVYIPVDDPMTCSWCGFRDRCQGTSIDDFTARLVREQTEPR